MRKIITFLTIFLLSFTLFSVSITTDFAFAKNETQQELEKEIEENVNSLIDDDLNSYFIGLQENFGFTLKEFIKGIIDGSISITADTIVNLLFSSLKSGIKGSLLSLVGILVLALLSSLSKSLTAGFKKEGVESLIHYSIYGAIVCTLAIIVGDTIKSITDTLYALNTTLDKTFPIILTLLTALGGVSGSSLMQPLTFLISNLVIKTIVNLIIPMFFAQLIFGFVGNLTNTIKLEKLNKTFKSISVWILGILFSFVTTFVTIQGLVGASIDTISIKSTKFALSTYIPILGGYLAEGFDIVMASCILIKNALGLSVFLIVLSLIITPLIKVILLSISLKLISAFIEPIGESKVANLLYDTASGLNIMVASLGGIAFLIFIILSLIIGAFNGGLI